MQTKNVVRAILLLASAALFLSAAPGAGPARASRLPGVGSRPTPAATAANTFNLGDYGAVGDGVADDGPALQSALDDVAAAGGGTLTVPAGRYAILTPVQKDFTGLASAITIEGVASSTPVPPPTAPGHELTRGLDLVSEFLPRTGEQGVTLNITGLQSFLLKDIALVGTPDASTDAVVTLALHAVEDATVRHCEFYGLSTQVGGAIVQAVRSRLTIEQSAFLGSTANSGLYSPVVQNLEWKGITVADTIFADYGQRPELFSKTGLAAPYSWINIGNAAAPTSDSPRREVVIRKVFLDEGGFVGMSSLPHFYEPPSAPIDLIYVTGLYMNVSNLGTDGHYLYGPQGLLIESSHYGWSHNADSAVNLLSVGRAILDELECVDHATRIRADAATGQLTVINSVYTHLDSLAQTTDVITGASADDDPVQYVRRQFADVLGRDPDAAAHFYWSDQILQCGGGAQCVAGRRAALAAYLAAAPQPNFSITGRVTDENGAAVPGVAVALSGSQSVATATDADGQYRFSGLPTSGVYTVTASKQHYTFASPAQTFTTPAGDRAGNFTATRNRQAVGGRVADAAGSAVAGATVTLSGSESATATTDAAGNYSFNGLPEGGNYIVTPSKTHYTFAPQGLSFNDLDASQAANFTATLNRHKISGRVTMAGGAPIADVTISLTGAQGGTATTDSAGNYIFANLPAGGTYTVAPAKANYSFDSSGRTFNDLGADQLANFTGALVSYTIRGRVTDAAGSALAGAAVALSGPLGPISTATTGADGGYSFGSLPAGAGYSVAVSKPNNAFSPPLRSYSPLNSDQSAADFAASLLTYTISGRVTEGGAGTSGVTVALSGSQTGQATTDAAGNYSFSVTAEGSYTVTPAKQHSTFAPASASFTNLGGNRTADFAATTVRTVEFGASAFSASEGAGSVQLTVTRTGDTSGGAEVTYSASDGTARQGQDLSTIIGTLRFAPGEASKSVTVFIADDAFAEPDETVHVTLGAAAGAALGAQKTATLTIDANDAGASGANPVDDAQFFVRQHYRDFLNRDPEADGLQFWASQITQCGEDAQCREVRRIQVSAAFFFSIEFQETGFLVHRLYQASYDRAPRRVEEFLLDTREVGEGVVVGTPGWGEKLEANKAAFVRKFVERPQFAARYPLALTPAQFVSALNANTGSSLTAAEAAEAAGEFGGAANTADAVARVRALRRVAENHAFSRRETNLALVLMQYFGYLQRNPDDAPDMNLDGYFYWLGKLNQFQGNYVEAEMVRAFILSIEYRGRFGR